MFCYLYFSLSQAAVWRWFYTADSSLKDNITVMGELAEVSPFRGTVIML